MTYPRDPISSPNLRMVSWNLSTMRFGGDWTPQSSSENMTGCLGLRNNDGYPLAFPNIAGGSISLFLIGKSSTQPGSHLPASYVR